MYCKTNPGRTRVNETKHLIFILYIFTISFQDVLLLADVMETFKKMCIAHYGLDPVHYYTVPGLALDAALKLTRVELELLTDLEMYMFMEENIRAGVTMISHRHAEANNPFVPSSYVETDPLSYLIYLDGKKLMCV